MVVYLRLSHGSHYLVHKLLSLYYCRVVGQFSLIVTLSTIHFSNDIGQQLVCRGVWYRALEGNGLQQSCHDSMMSVVSLREHWQLLPNE